MGLARDPRVWVAAALAAALAVLVPGLFASRLACGKAELAEARAAYRGEAAVVRRTTQGSPRCRATASDFRGRWGHLAALETERYRWPQLMSAAAASLPAYTWPGGWT